MFHGLMVRVQMRVVVDLESLRIKGSHDLETVNKMLHFCV